MIALEENFVNDAGVASLSTTVRPRAGAAPRWPVPLILLLAVTMAFMGALSSYAIMLGARLALGVTEGPQFGAAIATVKRWFPAREQAFANAVWTIGSPLGSAIGFPLVIFLVAQYGWRASF